MWACRKDDEKCFVKQFCKFDYSHLIRPLTALLFSKRPSVTSYAIRRAQHLWDWLTSFRYRGIKSKSSNFTKLGGWYGGVFKLLRAEPYKRSQQVNTFLLMAPARTSLNLPGRYRFSNQLSLSFIITKPQELPGLNHFLCFWLIKKISETGFLYSIIQMYR